MKLRKLLVALLAVVMAVGVATAFAACGDGDKKDDKKDPVNEKTYQLNGSLTDDLGPIGKGFEYMLNLNKDGSSVLSRYNPYNYNTEDAATNKDYDAEFMTGTWKAAKKEGIDCLQIKLAAKTQAGGTANDVTVYSYETAGVYSVEITVPIVVGQSFTRPISLTGGETKKYADANAFIQGTKKAFVAPESVTTFLAKQNDATIGTLYIQAEGKVVAYYGYQEVANGTYVKDATSMKVNLKGTEYTVTIEGNKGSFDYTHNIYGDYNAELHFVCEDLTKVPAFGDTEFEIVTYTGTYRGTEYSIKLTSATDCTYTGKMSYQDNTFDVPFDCTYKIGKDKVIALTVKEEPTGMTAGAWPGMKAITWTVNETDKTMTGAVNYTSVNDVNVTMQGSSMPSKLVIAILDDTNCKFNVAAVAGYGMGIFDCTYTVTDNVITLTIKAEPDADKSPVNAGLWNEIKTMLTWTLDETAHTMTVKA